MSGGITSKRLGGKEEKPGMPSHSTVNDDGPPLGLRDWILIFFVCGIGIVVASCHPDSMKIYRSTPRDVPLVAQAFDASRHPEVVAGRSTDKKQFAAFLDTFDVPGSSASTEDFLAYHRGVCAAAPNSEYFVAVVNDVWKAPNSKPSEVKPLASFERKPTSPVRSAGVPLRRVGEVTFGDDRREKVVKPRPRKTQREMDPGVARLLFDLRTQLAAHGARGISGLSRKFRICDDDGDGKLSHAEFNKAINELGLAELTSQERRVIFDHFDRDGSGSLSYEEFLSNVRGPLSQPRIEVIDQAFDILDLDKDGSILPDEIAQRFDASKHPDVLQGKCTQQDVYRDFLDTFDVGGVKDPVSYTHLTLPTKA